MPLFFAALLIGTTLPLAAGQLKVDESASEFRVDVGATGHSFELFLEAYQSDIVLTEGGQVESASFAFDMKDLKSDNKKRDRKMLAWIEHETTPTIRYELERIDTQGDGSKAGVGTLTMHGVTLPLQVPFEVEREGGTTTLVGGTTVDYRDYGLEVITMFFMKVKPELEISFRLVGTEVE